MNTPAINTSPEVVAQQVERLRLLYGRAYPVADLLEAIAAELIAARAKLAAAEGLAAGLRSIDESCLISDPEELGDMARAALAPWEAAQ